MDTQLIDPKRFEACVRAGIEHVLEPLFNDFARELGSTLEELISVPQPGWREELSAFCNRWEQRGIRILAESIREIEQCIDEEHAADDDCELQLTVSTRADAIAAGSHGDATTDQSQQEDDLAADRLRGRLPFLLPQDSPFNVSDADLALRIAAAIEARKARIAEIETQLRNPMSLGNQVVGFGHFLLLDMEYQKRWMAEYRAEQQKLQAEIDELKKKFSEAGLDELELRGQFGDDAIKEGGKGLAGAHGILSGFRHEKVGLESVFVNDALLVAGIIDLTAMLASRGMRAAASAVKRRAARAAESSEVVFTEVDELTEWDFKYAERRQARLEAEEEQYFRPVQSRAVETNPTSEGSNAVADASRDTATQISNRTRLPRTDGWWDGPPGNSLWYSTNPEINAVTQGAPIRFSNGRPVLSPWAAETLKFEPGRLNGTAADAKVIELRIAKEKNLASRRAARTWLRENGLSPHHADSQTIELVPTSLHGNLPHIGSASDMRGFSE